MKILREVLLQVLEPKGFVDVLASLKVVFCGSTRHVVLHSDPKPLQLFEGHIFVVQHSEELLQFRRMPPVRLLHGLEVQRLVLLRALFFTAFIFPSFAVLCLEIRLNLFDLNLE